MKVKLLVSRSCHETGSHPAGAIIDVDKAEALRMLNAGQAEPVATGRRGHAADPNAETR